MWIILAVILCALLGYLIVEPVWIVTRGIPAGLFYFCLAACFGIGMFSVLFLVARALNVNHIFKVDLLAVVLLATVRAVAGRRHERKPSLAHLSDFELPKSLQMLLIAAFTISICAAAYALLLRRIAYPHGDGWDAFAIWNLHARFLFLGGSHWRDGYNALIPWSHPDYPPLLPAAIAHFWTYLSRDATSVPATIGMTFTIATAAFLYSSLAINRGHNSAMMATLTLLSTPFFIEQGAAQYADIPLSFFFLATLALLRQGWITGSRRLVALSGVAAGFSAWTKNEGLLFLFSAVVGQALSLLLEKRSVGRSSLNRLIGFCLGAAPFLGLIFWYKHFLAPAGDLFASPTSMVGKVMSMGRYWVILRWFAKELLRFGDWSIIPLTVVLPALYLIWKNEDQGSQLLVRRASAWTLGFTLIGYFAIYVITPNDLYWHLRFSLNRLFVSMWPSAIFLFFSSVFLRSGAEISK